MFQLISVIQNLIQLLFGQITPNSSSVSKALLILVSCLPNCMLDLQTFQETDQEAVSVIEGELFDWWQANNRKTDLNEKSNREHDKPGVSRNFSNTFNHSSIIKSNVRKIRDGHYLNNGDRAPART